MSPDSSARGNGFNKTYSAPKIAKGFDIWQGRHCRSEDDRARACAQSLCSVKGGQAINRKGGG